MSDPNTVSSDYPAGGGRCEKCEMMTHIDEEGRTVCDGCNKPTPYCTCQTQA